jgi:hypothetical protein
MSKICYVNDVKEKKMYVSSAGPGMSMGSSSQTNLALFQRTPLARPDASTEG